MTPWPESLSGEAVESACEAARMGVHTAVIIGNARLREVVRLSLLAFAADATYGLWEKIPVWSFDSGGVLLLAPNMGAAKRVHELRCSPLEGHDLEIVYPKADRV